MKTKDVLEIVKDFVDLVFTIAIALIGVRETDDELEEGEDW